MNANTQSLPFDPDALGRKYQEERDKRVRADGNDQYQEVTGEFAYFVDDPYIDSELKRDAIEEVIEPFLIQQGFIQRTPRGRIATEKLKVTLHNHK